MCLSNCYREADRQLLMENTAQIRTEGELVILRDLFGRTLRIPGNIASIDLEKNIVIVQTKVCEE